MPSLGVEKALAHYPHLRRPLDMRAEWYLLIRFSGAQSVANEIIQLYERGFE